MSMSPGSSGTMGIRDPAGAPAVVAPDPVTVRFGIDYLDTDRTAFATSMSMMMRPSYRNPLTNAPTLGPLAVLVDTAAGIVNHYRHRPGQWTVSSELSMDVCLDGLGDLDGPVLASAHALQPIGRTSMGICALSYGGIVIGSGVVRSFFVDADVDLQVCPAETLTVGPDTTIADLMAMNSVPNTDRPVLKQRPDPILNNEIGTVHGGVAAAGLEFVASAAINQDQIGASFRSASLRVNFLRPFLAGADTRYVGTVLRVGRNRAVGDAQAIGRDGKVALTARVTAYR